MRIILIHSDTCPKCEKAIAMYRAGGIEPELYYDLSEIRDPVLRHELMAELMMKDVDHTALPIVFENGKYVKLEL